jgi:hypothetical protein
VFAALPLKRRALQLLPPATVGASPARYLLFWSRAPPRV